MVLQSAARDANLSSAALRVVLCCAALVPSGARRSPERSRSGPLRRSGATRRGVAAKDGPTQRPLAVVSSALGPKGDLAPPRPAPLETRRALAGCVRCARVEICIRREHLAVENRFKRRSYCRFELSHNCLRRVCLPSSVFCLLSSDFCLLPSAFCWLLAAV